MIYLQEGDTGKSVLRDLIPDFTPMLDILFILLVFFMLTAGTVKQSLELILPTGAFEELFWAGEPKHFMLEIRKNDYAVNGLQTHDFKQLQQRVSVLVQEKPGQTPIIAADKNIAVERLLKVLDYLRIQDIEVANILMQSNEEQL